MSREPSSLPCAEIDMRDILPYPKIPQEGHMAGFVLQHDFCQLFYLRRRVGESLELKILHKMMTP